MIFYKFRVAFVLLFTVVPAGCLPLMTAGIGVSEARAARRANPGAPQSSVVAKVAVIGGFVLLAVWSNFRILRLIRRVRDAQTAGEDGPFELSAGATWTLVAATYAMGVFCGGYFLMLFSTV